MLNKFIFQVVTIDRETKLKRDLGFSISAYNMAHATRQLKNLCVTIGNHKISSMIGKKAN